MWGAAQTGALAVQRLFATSTSANGNMAHHTVWCSTPDGPVPTEQETSQSGDSLSCPVLVLFTVRCATGSPVHRRTEGMNCLPNGAPTSPSCLRAIKGTPRRMEHYTKNSLNILRRLNSANTHLDHRDWDLSSKCVVNLWHCSCVLSSWLVCVLLLRF
jgi:hypothetical protein